MSANQLFVALPRIDPAILLIKKNHIVNYFALWILRPTYDNTDKALLPYTYMGHNHIKDFYILN